MNSSTYSRQEEQLNELESNSRRILGGDSSSEPGWTFLSLAAPERVTGYLVSASLGATWALPLREGLTVVGSGRVAHYTTTPNRLRGIIEGSQWRIVWDSARVTVADDRSTSGSVLVPKKHRATVPLSLLAAQKDPRCRPIGWDGTNRHDTPVELAAGDVLINAYASFIYVPMMTVKSS